MAFNQKTVSQNFSFVAFILFTCIAEEIYCQSTQNPTNTSLNIAAEGIWNQKEEIDVNKKQTDGQQGTPKCRISSTDPYAHNKIKDRVLYQVKLLEYELQFENYDVNPLGVNCSWTYRGYKWARAYNHHGQTLLSLAFNYGVMSLMTLTLGVENMHINLTDHPKGCVASLTEDEKVSAVMYLLMRDFNTGAKNITLKDQERICHEVILRNGKTAKFADRCCQIDPITETLTCTTDIINIWLQILFFCIASVKFGLLLFGPLLLIPLIESIADQYFPYVVKLKDPLVKTIYLCDSETQVNKTYDKILDLRGQKGFDKFKEAIKRIPVGEPVKVKFTRYDVMVKYNRLLVENEVPVGIFGSFIETFCRCRIQYIGPFIECCQTDMFLQCFNLEITWLTFFEKVASVLLVFLLPFPFYLRLIAFYVFESQDIINRRSVLSSLGLTESYNGGILTYLTPTHPLLITVYGLYFLTIFVIAMFNQGNRRERLKRIIIGSFRDLKHLSWIEALGVLVGNIIWPFKRYGISGCIIAPVYLLVVLPISVLVYSFYCLPSVYLTFRMLLHSPNKLVELRQSTGMYTVDRHNDNSMYNCKTDVLMNSISSQRNVLAKGLGPKKCLKFINIRHLFTILLCIITMLGALLIMSECLGFLVELVIFTMMGVIANAGAVLKYVTLLILIVLYSYDCYNNVGKKYLKLNKSLFSELKSRCKEIEKVTSLPSHLQENHGFKSQELSEQADYEESDDVDDKKPLQWMINDLVLFVDNEDMPRIPRDLFDEICEINVAGAPGPVYRSLIDATKEFLKILVFIFFVFVVVLTFGQVYRVSSTNQMLATMAGGFLPFLMRTFLTPSKPDIELGTVSFKSKLDEIIKNFNQSWPIYDLPFERLADDNIEEEHNDSESHKSDNNDHTISSDDESGKFENVDRQKNNEKFEQKQLQKEIGLDKDTNFKETEQLENTDTFLNANNNNTGDGSIDNGDSVTTGEQQPTQGYDVDILIYLPNAKKVREKWLDQWSDYDEVSDVESEDLYVNSLHKTPKDDNHYVEFTV